MQLSIYGSTGFIGSNFLKIYPEHLPIRREERRPLSKDILYLISYVSNSNINIDTSIFVKTNLSILCEVLNYCKGEGIIFNFISSYFVYGKLTSFPAKESSICNPSSFYSITTKCAEDLIISFSKTFNIKYRIIRMCNVLGKGDKNVSNTKNTLTWMINKLQKDETIELYDKGQQIRDIIHVKDACKAIELICKKGKANEIYNVGSGKTISIENFINYAKDKIQSNSKIKYVETPEFYANANNKYFSLDINKLLSLGFKLDFSHQDIIKEICI